MSEASDSAAAASLFSLTEDVVVESILPRLSRADLGRLAAAAKPLAELVDAFWARRRYALTSKALCGELEFLFRRRVKVTSVFIICDDLRFEVDTDRLLDLWSALLRLFIDGDDAWRRTQLRGLRFRCHCVPGSACPVAGLRKAWLGAVRSFPRLHFLDIDVGRMSTELLDPIVAVLWPPGGDATDLRQLSIRLDTYEDEAESQHSFPHRPSGLDQLRLYPTLAAAGRLMPAKWLWDLIRATKAARISLALHNRSLGRAPNLDLLTRLLPDTTHLTVESRRLELHCDCSLLQLHHLGLAALRFSSVFSRTEPPAGHLTAPKLRELTARPALGILSWLCQDTAAGVTQLTLMDHHSSESVLVRATMVNYGYELLGTFRGLHHLIIDNGCPPFDLGRRCLDGLAEFGSIWGSTCIRGLNPLSEAVFPHTLCFFFRLHLLSEAEFRATIWPRRPLLWFLEQLSRRATPALRRVAFRPPNGARLTKAVSIETELKPLLGAWTERLGTAAETITIMLPKNFVIEMPTIESPFKFAYSNEY